MTLVAASTSPAAPAVVRAASLPDSIKVEPLTCSIGARAEQRRPRRRLARQRDCSPRSARCCSSTGAVLPRPGHHAAPSTSPSRAASASWRTIRWPAATRSNPGLVRIYKTPDEPDRPLRERLALPTPPGARSRRSAACCAASNARRSAATRCGPTWRWPTRTCPSDVKTQIAGLRARHSIEASFGAAMPIEKRLALKAQFPDAEHPVVRTHPGDRREGPVRQRLHHPLHQLPHAGERALRPGLRARRGAAAAAT